MALPIFCSDLAACWTFQQYCANGASTLLQHNSVKLIHTKRCLLRNVTSALHCLISQVMLFVKFVLLMPATNAVSKKECFSYASYKSILAQYQTQLINIMVIHIHNHLTESILLNEFESANDERRKLFEILCILIILFT